MSENRTGCAPDESLRAELSSLAFADVRDGIHTIVNWLPEQSELMGTVLVPAKNGECGYIADTAGDVYKVTRVSGSEHKSEHKLDLSDPGVQMFLASILDELAPVALAAKPQGTTPDYIIAARNTPPKKPKARIINYNTDDPTNGLIMQGW